jgi:hypothetical protein
MTSPLRQNKSRHSPLQMVGRWRKCAAPFMPGGTMTESRWELTVVTLVAVTVFFSVWHLVAPLIR